MTRVDLAALAVCIRAAVEAGREFTLFGYERLAVAALIEAAGEWDEAWRFPRSYDANNRLNVAEMRLAAIVRGER